MKYRVLCDTKAFLVMSGNGPYLYECLREGDIIDGDAKDGSVCYPNAKGYVYMVSLTDVSPLFPESRGTTANEFNRMQAMADMPDVTQMQPPIEEEARNIVEGARQGQYGKPEDGFAAIASLWSGYLKAAGIASSDLTCADVCRMMQLLKMARRIYGHDHRDSYVDGIGYLLCESKVNGVER